MRRLPPIIPGHRKIEKLGPLAPRPRAHLTRYHGVLAHAQLAPRPELVSARIRVQRFANGIACAIQSSPEKHTKRVEICCQRYHKPLCGAERGESFAAIAPHVAVLEIPKKDRVAA